MKLKRIISALAISFGLLLTLIGVLSGHAWPVHARPLRDIGGSSVTPDHTDYYSGTSNVYSLSVHNASSDAEWLDEVKVVFPDNWTITGAASPPKDSCNNSISFNTNITGPQITFHDSEGDGWGEIGAGCSWGTVVTATAPITTTGKQTVTWSLSGDEAGGEPHDITDTFTLSPPEVVPLTDVTITGVYTGNAYTHHTFTATVTPATATHPIDYVWQATDQVPETHEDSGTSNTKRFKWNSEGLKTITVTASNAEGSVSSTHTITITLPDVAPQQMKLNGPTAGLTDTIYTYTAKVNPLTTTQPITYVWQATDNLSKTVSNGLQEIVTFTWNTTGTKAITATVMNAAGTISEAVETQITASSAPPTKVYIRGPEIGLVGTGYTFSANVDPATTTQPITYTWQATGQSTATHSGYLSDTASFTWAQSGPQIITVTASNAAGAVTDTHAITVGDPLSDVTITGPARGFDQTTYPFTATASPSSTLQPITYNWQATDHSSMTHASGLSDVVEFNWNTPGTKTITVTATNAASFAFNTYTIALDASICLTVSPTMLHFSAVESGTNPLPQDINIINCGSGELEWLASKLESSSWLIITPTQGMNSSTITASATISGMTTATYTDTIRVTGRGEGQLTQEDIPVTLRIGSGTIYLPLVIKNWPPTPGTPHLNAIEEPDADPSYPVDWEPASRADTYILEQATQSNFSDAEVIYDGEDTSYSVESEGIARYYYRVKAHNEFGDGDWSNVQSVEVRWEEEPNDTAQEEANGPLVSGTTYYGKILPDDLFKDYYFIDLSTSHSVDIWLTNIPAGSDYDLVLYDASMNQEGLSNLGSNKDEHIAKNSLPPGRYYIQVARISGGSTQPYHLQAVYE